jgi:hypothetical protein
LKKSKVKKFIEKKLPEVCTSQLRPFSCSLLF